MRNILFLIGLGLALIVLIYMVYLYLEYVTLVKVKYINKNVKDITKEEMLALIENMKISKKVEKLGRDDIEEFLRVSRDPWHLSPTLYKMFTIFLPVIIALIGIDISLVSYDASYAGVAIVAALGLFIIPNMYLKSRIDDREIAWSKCYGYIWRLREELRNTDTKKTLMIMSDYFVSIGEDELARGFNDYYEYFPKEKQYIEQSVHEFEKMYPFPIPVQLYNLLLEAWANNMDAEERLESFKESAVLSYKRTSDKLISSVPMKGTFMSLPFLLLSVIIALLIPSMLDILKSLT